MSPTPTAGAFDHLTSLAAAIFGTPMAFVTVLEPDSQWMRSACGAELCVMPREDSFCTHTAEGGAGAVLVVEDAGVDPTFMHKASVTAEGGIRFYAGAAITRPDGVVDGAMCVADTVPRPAPTDAQLQALRRLAALAAEHIGMLDRAATERRHAEQLRLAEAMSGVGHWRLDTVSGRVDWSDEVYRIHGVDPGAFNPNYAEGVAFYRPDEQARVRAIVQSVIDTGRPASFEAVLVRADGSERHVASRAAAELDEEGRTVALFGVFQDVTDREEGHRRVAASEARYRLLAENTTDVIGIIDLEGVNTFISPASERVTGWTPEQLVGRSTLELIHPEDRETVRATYRDLARSRRSRPDHPVRYRGQRPDGAYTWLEAQPTLVLRADGKPSHFTDVVRDITRRKATEDALEQAVAAAEAAAAAKAEFLANVSHELRTPLTSIIGFVGLLQQFGTLTEQDRRFVNRIGAGGEALLAMIGDVLDSSKLEVGAVELHEEPLELASFLADSLSLVGPAAGEKWLKLTTEIADDAPAALTVDRTRLRQVLMNLLNNAVKFTAEGEVILRAEAAGLDQVRIGVTDTGIGVPEAARHRLFKRFSQVDGSTVRDYGGTGLGLAICKSLVELMGGRIGCDTVEGQGSTFWFTLPAAGANAATSPLAQAA